MRIGMLVATVGVLAAAVLAGGRTVDLAEPASPSGTVTSGPGDSWYDGDLWHPDRR
jgi:hypothetical protein